MDAHNIENKFNPQMLRTFVRRVIRDINALEGTCFFAVRRPFRTDGGTDGEDDAPPTRQSPGRSTLGILPVSTRAAAGSVTFSASSSTCRPTH
ncbi:MAG: hypothetical protein V3W41_08150 [Planctomycetota bacterium]